MGKYVGYMSGTGLGPGLKFRLVRAYVNGRQIYPSSSNPHPASTPENTAWQLGYDNRADSAYRYETGI